MFITSIGAHLITTEPRDMIIHVNQVLYQGSRGTYGQLHLNRQHQLPRNRAQRELADSYAMKRHWRRQDTRTRASSSSFAPSRSQRPVATTSTSSEPEEQRRPPVASDAPCCRRFNNGSPCDAFTCDYKHQCEDCGRGLPSYRCCRTSRPRVRGTNVQYKPRQRR